MYASIIIRTYTYHIEKYIRGLIWKESIYFIYQPVGRPIRIDHIGLYSYFLRLHLGRQVGRSNVCMYVCITWRATRHPGIMDLAVVHDIGRVTIIIKSGHRCAHYMLTSRLCVSVWICMSVSVCVYLLLCACMCLRVCMFVWTCVYVWSVYVSVSVRVCTHVCIYVVWM